MIKKKSSRCRDAAGDEYTVKFIQKFEEKNITSVEKGDKWWDAFSSVVVGQCGAKLIKTIFPGNFPGPKMTNYFNTHNLIIFFIQAATDGRYVRSRNIPVLGFSPIKKHPILLHDHNERIHETCLLEGRDIYQKLIPTLSNCQ